MTCYHINGQEVFSFPRLSRRACEVVGQKTASDLASKLIRVIEQGLFAFSRLACRACEIVGQITASDLASELIRFIEQ